MGCQVKIISMQHHFLNFKYYEKQTVTTTTKQINKHTSKQKLFK